MQDLTAISISLYYRDILLVWKSKKKAILIDTCLENRNKIIELVRMARKDIKALIIGGTLLDYEQSSAIKKFEDE